MFIGISAEGGWKDEDLSSFQDHSTFLYFVNRLYRTLRVDFRSKLTTSVEEKEKSLLCFLFSLVCPQRNKSPHISEPLGLTTKNPTEFWSSQVKLFKCRIRCTSKHLHDNTVTANFSGKWKKDNSLPHLKLVTEKVYFCLRPGIKALGNTTDNFTGHRTSKQVATHIIRDTEPHTSTTLQWYSPQINKAWILLADS